MKSASNAMEAWSTTSYFSLPAWKVHSQRNQSALAYKPSPACSQKYPLFSEGQKERRYSAATSWGRTVWIARNGNLQSKRPFSPQAFLLSENGRFVMPRIDVARGNRPTRIIGLSPRSRPRDQCPGLRVVVNGSAIPVLTSTGCRSDKAWKVKRAHI